MSDLKSFLLIKTICFPHFLQTPSFSSVTQSMNKFGNQYYRSIQYGINITKFVHNWVVNKIQDNPLYRIVWLRYVHTFYYCFPECVLQIKPSIVFLSTFLTVSCFLKRWCVYVSTVDWIIFRTWYNYIT